MAASENMPPKRERKPSNVTMASIAAHTGVSRATVTVVLHGRGDEERIRPEIQQRVRDAARALGYRPNVSARALRDGRFGNIGLVQSYNSIYLPIELLRGISDAVSARKLHLMFKEVQATTMDEEAFLPSVVGELTADGLLINRIPDLAPRFIDLIHEYRIPAVFLNVNEPVDSVHPDDVFAGWFMTDHLLQLGHERIAYVASKRTPSAHYSEADRRAGYVSAMGQAGREAWILEMPEYPKTSEEGIYDPRIAAAEQLLRRPDRPTGIVAYELAEAMAVVHAARGLGLSLPRDLSLILCYHGPDHRFCVPLCIFTNGMYQVGTTAVEMLVEKLANPDLRLPPRPVRGEYLGGATCAAPPK